MEKMKELYKKVAADTSLQAKFAEIIKDAETDEKEMIKEKLVSLAKGAGYEVSFDEAQEFFKSLAEKKEGVLSEQELDAVAGGKSEQGWVTVLISTASIGAACVMLSAMETHESGFEACYELFK